MDGCNLRSALRPDGMNLERAADILKQIGHRTVEGAQNKVFEFPAYSLTVVRGYVARRRVTCDLAPSTLNRMAQG